MKKCLLCLLLVCAQGFTFAATVNGVTLYDMYGTREVSLMSREELLELQALLKEEKSVFPKAMAEVTKYWDALLKEADKRGIKTFPKIPKTFKMEPRYVKIKGNMDEKAGDKWLTKQRKIVDAEMTVMAKAIKKAEKAAKSSAVKFLGKKAQRARDKADLDAAVSERIGMRVEAAMARLLKYNRPVPRIFIVDPVAGPEKFVKKQMAIQEAALAAYENRKAEGADETPADK